NCRSVHRTAHVNRREETLVAWLHVCEGRIVCLLKRIHDDRAGLPILLTRSGVEDIVLLHLTVLVNDERNQVGNRVDTSGRNIAHDTVRNLSCEVHVIEHTQTSEAGDVTHKSSTLECAVLEQSLPHVLGRVDLSRKCLPRQVLELVEHLNCLCPVRDSLRLLDALDDCRSGLGSSLAVRGCRIRSAPTSVRNAERVTVSPALTRAVLHQLVCESVIARPRIPLSDSRTLSTRLATDVLGKRQEGEQVSTGTYDL